MLREHEDDKCVVLDEAVRSFAPVEPLVLRWSCPLWRPDNEADPTLLKGRKPHSEEWQDEKDRKGMLEVVDVLRTWSRDEDGPATPNRITEKTPYGRTKTSNLLSKLLHNGDVTGDVTRKPLVYHGNDTHEYALSETTKT